MFVTAGLTPQRLHAQQTSTLTIQVTGLKNANGQVCIRLWNKKDGFPTNDRKALRTIEVPITNGSASGGVYRNPVRQIRGEHVAR
jgi:uncharacterized protein (DUF2141 family)